MFFVMSSLKSKFDHDLDHATSFRLVDKGGKAGSEIAVLAASGAAF